METDLVILTRTSSLQVRKDSKKFTDNFTDLHCRAMDDKVIAKRTGFLKEE